MYNKLFAKILDSSIWLEPTPTRIVWLTMIAAMDEDGFVEFASAANVAHRARVSLDEAQQALSTLESPDLDSADPDHAGRRIERVPGGWVVLNAEKYRAVVTKVVARERTRERVRKHRQAKRAVTLGNAPVTPSEAEAEAEAKSESAAPDGAPSQPLTPAGLAELWNTRTTPPLPRCLTPLSDARQGRVRARLREHPQPEFWLTVLSRIEASAFCRGENDRGWRASFDWLLQADVGAKVLEGKYDGRPAGTTPKEPAMRWIDDCTRRHAGSCAKARDHYARTEREREAS